MQKAFHSIKLLKGMTNLSKRYSSYDFTSLNNRTLEQRLASFKANDPDWSAKTSEILALLGKAEEKTQQFDGKQEIIDAYHQYLHSIKKNKLKMKVIINDSSRGLLSFMMLLTAFPSKRIPKEVRVLLWESFIFHCKAADEAEDGALLLKIMRDFCVLSKREEGQGLFKDCQINLEDKRSIVMKIYSLTQKNAELENLLNTSRFISFLIGDKMNEEMEKITELTDLIFKIALETREKLVLNLGKTEILKAILIANYIQDRNLFDETLLHFAKSTDPDIKRTTLGLISEDQSIFERNPKFFKEILLKKNKNLIESLCSLSCQEVFELSRVFDDQFFDKDEVLALMKGFLLDSSKKNPAGNLFRIVSRGEDILSDSLLPMKKDLILRFFLENFDQVSANGFLFLHFLSLQQKINLGKYDSVLLSAISLNFVEQPLPAQLDVFRFTKKLTKIKRKFPSYFSRLSDLSVKIISSVATLAPAPQAEIQKQLQGLFYSRELAFFPVFDFERRLDDLLETSETFCDLNDRKNEFLLFALTSSGARVLAYYKKMQELFQKRQETLPISSKINYIYSFFINGNFDKSMMDFVHKEIEMKNFLLSLKKPQVISKLLLLMLYQMTNSAAQKIDPRLALKPRIIHELIETAHGLFSAEEDLFVRDFKVILIFLKFLHKNVFLALNEQTRSLFGPLKKQLHFTNSKTKNEMNHFQNDFVNHLKVCLGSHEISENVFLVEGDSSLECDVAVRSLKLFIELYGPSHFLSDDPFVLRPQTFLMQALKAEITGFRLVIITYYEWMELSQPEEKRRFINKKLKLI